MTAGVGDVVGIYMDTTRRLKIGDFIQTDSGRTYEILAIRIQARGIHEGRQHLRVMVVPPKSAEGGTVHPIAWYPRRRRQR